MFEYGIQMAEQYWNRKLKWSTDLQNTTSTLTVLEERSKRLEPSNWLPGLLGPRVVAPDKVLSMGQIELFSI